jgi:hypothetical protein
MVFHEGLQELIFNGNVLVDLFDVTLPTSIRTLKLGSPIHRSITARYPGEILFNPHSLPSRTSPWPITLTSVTFYNSEMLFDSSRITHLTIGSEHSNHRPVSLHKLDLLCVQELTLGERFRQDIQNVKFRDINTVHDYSCRIDVNSCAFPSTLHKIMWYVRDDNGSEDSIQRLLNVRHP